MGAPPPLAVLVFASGAAGLVYQSLWMRSFGLVFGNTTDAVALVLATFMGGLALGSALAAGRSVASPLRAYALVELGIARDGPPDPAPAAGASRALCLGGSAARPHRSRGRPRPRLRGSAGAASRDASSSGRPCRSPSSSWPARGRDVHEALGRLYLVNTLGGALGVALGPFVLLPALGVSGSFVAAALRQPRGRRRRLAMEPGARRGRSAAPRAGADGCATAGHGVAHVPLRGPGRRFGGLHVRHRGDLDALAGPRARLVGLRLRLDAPRRAPGPCCGSGVYGRLRPRSAGRPAPWPSSSWLAGPWPSLPPG